MKFIKILLLYTVMHVSYSASAQVPEIPDPQLQDIAMVRYDPNYNSAVIVYNPIICNQIGAACGFFRTHEYGHVVLGHAFMHPSSYPALKEAQADRWAAFNGNPHEILAAYYLFINGGSSKNIAIYGHPLQRAARLRNYAIQAGNWIGP